MTTVATVERLAEAGDWTALVSTCEDAELDLVHDDLEAAASAQLYAAQLLGHLLLRELEAARFVWKRAPAAAQAHAEVSGAWAVGKALWRRDTTAARAALTAGSWTSKAASTLASALERRVEEEEWDTIARAFTVVSPETLAARLGLSAAAAAAAAQQRGWRLEEGTYRPVAPPPATKPGPGEDALAQLTEYVAHLTAEVGAA